MRKNGPAIFAAILLPLPVLYLGSYLALVKPGKGYIAYGSFVYDEELYRWQPATCSKLFWPLEQIDRKLRPAAW